MAVTHKIISSTAQHSGYGRYYRIGIVAIDTVVIDPAEVTTIRTRKGVTVVQTWEHLCYGTTERSQWHKAMNEARAALAALNQTTNQESVAV